MVTRDYTSFSLDPTLKRYEMTEQLKRDDANPSDDANPETTQNYHILLYFWLEHMTIAVNSVHRLFDYVINLCLLYISAICTSTWQSPLISY